MDLATQKKRAWIALILSLVSFFMPVLGDFFDMIIHGLGFDCSLSSLVCSDIPNVIILLLAIAAAVISLIFVKGIHRSMATTAMVIAVISIFSNILFWALIYSLHGIS